MTSLHCAKFRPSHPEIARLWVNITGRLCATRHNAERPAPADTGIYWQLKCHVILIFFRDGFDLLCLSPLCVNNFLLKMTDECLFIWREVEWKDYVNTGGSEHSWEQSRAGQTAGNRHRWLKWGRWRHGPGEEQSLRDLITRWHVHPSEVCNQVILVRSVLKNKTRALTAAWTEKTIKQKNKTRVSHCWKGTTSYIQLVCKIDPQCSLSLLLFLSRTHCFAIEWIRLPAPVAQAPPPFNYTSSLDC